MLLLCTLTPLSFINAVIYIFESGQILVAACVIVSFVCMSFLMIRSIKKKTSKVVASVFCASTAAFILFFSSIVLTFGNIGHTTVIKSIESPDGTFYAYVIDSDEGAFGGGTIVEVYEKREINVFIFKLKDNPQTVYLGEWREYESMHISWKGDKCLVINSVEHEIE